MDRFEKVTVTVGVIWTLLAMAFWLFIAWGTYELITWVVSK